MSVPIPQPGTFEHYEGLPSMVSRAAANLASAKTSAEVLEAREFASVVYDAAKKAARMARAKDAHDSLIAAAHRAQADALEIESMAKRRLADEYDAAQERGEVGRSGTRTDLVGTRNEVQPATAADLGLRRDQIHEARKIRDAEQAQPGIVRQTLDVALREKREPSKAVVREAVLAAAKSGLAPEGRSKKAANPIYRPDPAADRVGWFTARCKEVAEIENIGAIAAWADRPFMVERAHNAALAAKAKIEEYLAAKEQDHAH